LLARRVAVGAEAPAIRLGDEVTARAEEAHVVDLLDRPAGEAGPVLNQVLQPSLGGDRLVAPDPAVPSPVGAGPHGVHAGDAADIARDDAAGGKQEARQRDDAA